MRDLPKVFANKIDKDINKSQNLFYGSNRNNNIRNNSINIDKKINSIFNSNNYIYKSNVRITTIDNILDKIIIGKNKNSLITNEGELIYIKDIIDIEKI